MSTIAAPSRPADHWLKRYYTVRALFSIVWVALAFTIGRSLPPAAVALIIAYPLWDCLANYVDGSRNGGLSANPTQLLNVVVSAMVTLAVIAVVPHGFDTIVAVIGVWATLSGILQLATAVRRWRSADAQWPMILSGAQSGLAGVFMVKRAAGASLTLGVADIAPYAAFGAIYFAISALALAFRQRRGQAA